MRRFAVVASVLVLGLSGCATGGPSDWVGGPVTPSPVTITYWPSAMPVGETMPTGIDVAGQEMVLYFWNANQPYLDVAWRDRASGAVHEQPGLDVLTTTCGASPPWLALYELSAPDGQVVDFGAVRAPVARLSDEFRGSTVDAKYARWTADPGVTVFWLRRPGGPMPTDSQLGGDREVPLDPSLYPLVTAYAADGRELTSARVRSLGGAPRTY
jgi:hypothetical protein